MTGTGESRFDVFVQSLQDNREADLAELEQRAQEQGVPIIRPRTRGLLQFLIVLRRPQAILEIGTATGFSALVMDRCARREGISCRITTIEKDPARAAQAAENFRCAGAQVELLEGDALEILPGLTGPYDLIFMDAAKGQYGVMLPPVLNLLGEQGVLVTDNILHGGEVLESRYNVIRRDRTIHRKMREYLRMLTQNPSLETVLLEMEDGAAVSVRKR